MLKKAQLAVRGQDSVDLVEHGLLTGDAAQDKGGHGGVERGVPGGEFLGDAVGYLDRDGGGHCVLEGDPAQERVRLDGQHRVTPAG